MTSHNTKRSIVVLATILIFLSTSLMATNEESILDNEPAFTKLPLKNIKVVENKKRSSLSEQKDINVTSADGEQSVVGIGCICGLFEKLLTLLGYFETQESQMMLSPIF